MALYKMKCDCGNLWSILTSGATGVPDPMCPKCKAKGYQEYGLGSNKVYTSFRTPEQEALHRDNVKMIHDHADDIVSGKMTLRQGKNEDRIEVPYDRRFY